MPCTWMDTVGPQPGLCHGQQEAGPPETDSHLVENTATCHVDMMDMQATVCLPRQAGPWTHAHRLPSLTSYRICILLVRIQ